MGKKKIDSIKAEGELKQNTTYCKSENSKKPKKFIDKKDKSLCEVTTPPTYPDSILQETAESARKSLEQFDNNDEKSLEKKDDNEEKVLNKEVSLLQSDAVNVDNLNRGAKEENAVKTSPNALRKKFTKPTKKSVWNCTKKLSKRWFIDAFTGMAQGLFVTLIAGLIVKQIGKLIGASTAVGKILILAGDIASMLTGAGIGAGIASHLKAPRLVIFGSMVAGLIGAFAVEFTSGSFAALVAGGAAIKIGSPGNPIGAYICSLIACEIGMLVAGKTRLDILVVPLVVILTAVLASFVSLPAIWFINLIGEGIKKATEIQPFVMGIVISVSVGILLTMPTSSAAICISLGIGGVAGGAAVVGCAAQMVGFAVMSFNENKFSGLVSQGLGTSMLQIPNIMKNPKIFIPPIVASAIVGPLATTVFNLECNAAGSGMGTSGLVGVIATIESSINVIPAWKLGLGIALLFFVIPAAVCFAMGVWFRKMGWIKKGDLALNYDN